MSIQTTRPFLQELESRRSRVERFAVAAHEIAGMSVDERIEVVEDVTAYLADTLLPHAEAARQLLYPEMDRQCGCRDAAASVVFDAEEIRARIAELAHTDPHDTGRLQELFYALHLLCSTHVQKEEEVYLRLLREDPHCMERVMGEMAEVV